MQSVYYNEPFDLRHIASYLAMLDPAVWNERMPHREIAHAKLCAWCRIVHGHHVNFTLYDDAAAREALRVILREV